MNKNFKSKDERTQKTLQNATKAYSVIRIVVLIFASIISLALFSGLVWAAYTVIKGLGTWGKFTL